MAMFENVCYRKINEILHGHDNDGMLRYYTTRALVLHTRVIGSRQMLTHIVETNYGPTPHVDLCP
jgi:hypothetical protein